MSSGQIQHWLEAAHEDVARLLAPSSDGHESRPTVAHAIQRLYDARCKQSLDSDHKVCINEAMTTNYRTDHTAKVVGARIRRMEGRTLGEGTIEAIHGSVAGDTLVTLRMDDGSTVQCYTRQIAVVQ